MNMKLPASTRNDCPCVWHWMEKRQSSDKKVPRVERKFGSVAFRARFSFVRHLHVIFHRVF